MRGRRWKRPWPRRLGNLPHRRRLQPRSSHSSATCRKRLDLGQTGLAAGTCATRLSSTTGGLCFTSRSSPSHGAAGSTRTPRNHSQAVERQVVHQRQDDQGGQAEGHDADVGQPWQAHGAAGGRAGVQHAPSQRAQLQPAGLCFSLCLANYVCGAHPDGRSKLVIA